MHKTVNFFYIVRVEEQNQGLDNPSNPPCCCRFKCNSRTNADRHTSSKARWEFEMGRDGEEVEGRLFTRDSTSGWPAWGTAARC